MKRNNSLSYQVNNDVNLLNALIYLSKFDVSSICNSLSLPSRSKALSFRNFTLIEPVVFDFVHTDCDKVHKL